MPCPDAIVPSGAKLAHDGDLGDVVTRSDDVDDVEAESRVSKQRSTDTQSNEPPVVVLAWAAAGFVAVFAVGYLYANLDPMEVMAAEAKGERPWSTHQIPFAIFYAFVGALLAGSVGWIVSAVRSPS